MESGYVPVIDKLVTGLLLIVILAMTEVFNNIIFGSVKAVSDILL
jgi:hypothetical protein